CARTLYYYGPAYLDYW
nr:immunoglobulin heavy chain junction region [Mus musculus]